MPSQIDFEQLANRFNDKASADDIFYSFSPYTWSNPNPEERGHLSRVGQPLTEVVRSYVHSLEFDRRNLLKAKEVENIILVEGDGFVIYVDPGDLSIGRQLAISTETYEPHVQSIFQCLLKPGMVVLDIGANVGLFTMLAAALVGPKGRVIAVEPNPENARLLEASRRKNRFTHVDIDCLAAAERAGLLALNPSGSNATVAPLGDNFDSLLRSSIVPSINLDALVPTNLHIGFIKIDVERYEFKALKGLEQTLRRCHPIIISEFAPTAMEPGEGRAYLKYLIQLGYSLGVVQANGVIAECSVDVNEVMRIHAASAVDHIDIIARTASNGARRPFAAQSDLTASVATRPRRDRYHEGRAPTIDTSRASRAAAG